MYLITYSGSWMGSASSANVYKDETRERPVPTTFEAALIDLEEGLADLPGVDSFRVIHADPEAGTCADVTDLVAHDLRSKAFGGDVQWLRDHPAVFPFGYDVAAE